ncbi:hypothetical protein bcgnr5378_30020 [Bacillus cereus]|uniref:Uncharacterized protein n=1 Tax=Bacillus cereus TaxID=1396 RepID=A0A161R783_BACCE|nr:pilin [Bacillus cereus]KZD72111.1 hypothetical protein B4088_0572 [Bacillus cereus]
MVFQKTNNKWLGYMLAFLIAVQAMFTFAPTQTTFAAATCADGTILDPTTGEWQDSSGRPISDEQKKACQKMGGELSGKIMKFVTAFSGIAVVLAIGVIVYGGVKYIISNGNEKTAEEAKTQIWYAFIGLLIIGAAFIILKFVLQAVGF